MEQMQALAERREKMTSAKQELLNKRLRAEHVEGNESVVLTHDLEHRYDPFPVSDMVQAQWMGRSDAYDLGNQSAHVYAEFFDGEVNLDNLEKAWNRLIARHEMLRGIVRLDGRHQILKDVPWYKMEVVDLTQHSDEAREKELFTLRRRMTRQVVPAHVYPLFELRASLISENVTRVHLCCELLIADIKSFQTMGEELAKLYASPEVELQPDPLQVSYRDYVIAMNQVKATPSYENAKTYWLEQRLPELPGPPELPMAKSLSTVDVPYFVHRATRLDGDKWRRLQHTARQHGLTPDLVICAAFVDVIGYWNGSLDFMLNVLSFRRMPVHDHVAEIVGNFGSTILLEVRGSQAKTFLGRAKMLRDQLLADLNYSTYSGVQLLREMNRLKGGSVGALMPVVLASTLNYSGGKEKSIYGEKGSSFYESFLRYLQLQTPQVWFDHQVAEEDGELKLDWDVVEDLFPAGLIDAMWDGYIASIDRLASDDTAWLRPTRRDLMPQRHLAHRQTINATQKPYPNTSLHALFEAQVETQPEAVAVTSPNGSLTYAELESQANRIANWLLKNDVSPGELVAVVIEPGCDQVAAVLGILKAGAAYLPIEPKIPTERFKYILQNGNVRHAITTSDVGNTMDWPSNVSRGIAGSQDINECQKVRPEQHVDPENLAYVIYTSGSTGTPKGVMISHAAATNTIFAVNDRLQIKPEDRVFSLSSLTFDLSVYDIFGMLAAGAAVVMPDPVTSRDPGHWIDLLRDSKVTVWNTVPALMGMLIDHIESRRLSLPETLRVVMLSGDWIPLGLPARIVACTGKKAVGALSLYSLGGATEAAIWSIIFPIDEVEPGWKSVPYGKPLSNQQFHILNEADDPTPVWVAGDLYIGGDGLAIGYWEDEDKTQKAFVTHPVSGERLYKTGDRGRYLPDGNIEFFGRDDTQVKLRGHRIELGEIEAVLESHTGVKQAVTVVIGTTQETKQLVAYVLLEDFNDGSDEDSLKSQILAHAGENLPDYMIPDIEVMDQYPLNVNGKVDRNALATIDRIATLRERVAYAAPESENEKIIAGIWQDVLQLEKVGVADNFFEIGGNSLLITHIVSKMSEAFQIDVPLQELFQSVTVREAAALMDVLLRGDGQVSDVDLEADAELDDSLLERA